MRISYLDSLTQMGGKVGVTQYNNEKVLEMAEMLAEVRAEKRERCAMRWLACVVTFRIGR
jgi:hypothetical protein